MKLLIVLCCVVAAMAEQMSYRVPIDYKGISLKEDVMLDEDKQYAVVTVEDANLNPGHQNSINMHDFETGYSVVKDVEAGKCYIIHTRHTLGDMKIAIEDLVEGLGQHEMKEYLWSCNNKVSTYDEVEEKAGKKIANFCKAYKSQFVTRRERSSVEKMTRARDIFGDKIAYRRRRAYGRTYWCINCSGSC